MAVFATLPLPFARWPADAEAVLLDQLPGVIEVKVSTRRRTRINAPSGRSRAGRGRDPSRPKVRMAQGNGHHLLLH